MVRKMMCVLFAAALLLSISTQANAAEETGSIRISLDTGELPVTNGAVTLYRVGVKTSDGYRITDTFGGGMVKEGDATSPHLAQWLAETEDVYGKTLLLDVDGNAVFSNLGEGLYMAVQTERMDGFHPFKPFLVALPSEGEWDILISPMINPIVTQLPQTGQHPAPIIGFFGMLLSGTGLILCWITKRKWL